MPKRSLLTTEGEGLATPPLLPQIKPRNVDLRGEYLAGGVWGGILGSYLHSLPQWTDTLSRDNPRIYEQMLLDPIVHSQARIIKLAVLTDDVEVRPAIDDRDHPDHDLAVDLADFITRVYANLPRQIEDVCYELLDGIFMGNRLAEKMATVIESGADAGLMVWERISIRPRSSFAYVVDAHGNVVGLLARIPGESLATLPLLMSMPGSIIDNAAGVANFLPREKFMVFTWDPQDGDPRGRPLLRTCYEPWYHKQLAIAQWLQMMARTAVPSLFGTPPPGADFLPAIDTNGNPLPGTQVSAVQQLQQALVQFQGGSAMAAPAGTKIDVIESRGYGAVFTQRIGYADTCIARAITLQELATAQAKHGTRAQAQVHQDTMATGVQYIRRCLARVLTEDLHRPLIAWNWGEDVARRLCPYASLTALSAQDISTSLPAYAAVGYQLDPSQLPSVDEQLGLPPRDPNAAPPAPAAGPAANQGGGAPPGGPETGPSAPPGTNGPAGKGGPGNAGFGRHLSGPADAPFYDPEEPRDEQGRWTDGGGGGSGAHAEWEARDAARSERRQAAEEAVLPGDWESQQFVESQRALEADPTAERAREHAALYEGLRAAQAAALKEAGATESELGRVDKLRERAKAAVDKEVQAHAAALGQVTATEDAVAELETAEPEEPGDDAYPEEPEYESPPEPDEEDFADPEEYQTAHDSWETQDVRDYAAWEKAHATWERAVEKVDKAFEVAQGRWERAYEKAQAKAEAAVEKAGTTITDLTDTLDEWDDKVGAVVADTADAIQARLDAEEEKDPEPDEEEDVPPPSPPAPGSAGFNAHLPDPADAPFYDPEEPRDEQGRWAGGAAAAEAHQWLSTTASTDSPLAVARASLYQAVHGAEDSGGVLEPDLQAWASASVQDEVQAQAALAAQAALHADGLRVLAGGVSEKTLARLERGAQARQGRAERELAAFARKAAAARALAAHLPAADTNPAAHARLERRLEEAYRQLAAVLEATDPAPWLARVRTLIGRAGQKAAPGSTDFSSHLPDPADAPFYDPDEPRDERGQWATGGSGSRPATGWEGRDASRSARRSLAENATLPEGHDPHELTAARKALAREATPSSARDHVAAYGKLWADQEDTLRRAGATEKEITKVAETRQRLTVAVDKHLTRYTTLADRAAALEAEATRLEEAEPEEPTPLSEPEAPDEPQEKDFSDPAAFEKAQSDYEAAHAGWETAHNAWETATEKAQAAYEKAHERWNTASASARDKADTATARSDDALTGLTDALDGADGKMEELVQKVSDAIQVRLDREAEGDPEPESTEESSTA